MKIKDARYIYYGSFFEGTIAVVSVSFKAVNLEEETPGARMNI